ncbi:MAG: adenylate kinase [Clostridia bacterium]|nr:adenylate kinase [Clostridia bacterium]
MKLVFLGPPGAGKGTQAAKVSKALNIAHISTGDMFRQAIGEGTKVGLKAKSFIDAGKLVPDHVTIEMVEERLGKDDCKNGYLLDGFPRNVEQAIALDKIARPDYVVNIAVPDEHLLSRLTGRRVCPDCKGTFHISRLEDEHVCPDCSGKLYQRPDDSEQTIKARLDVYHTSTSPLEKYYSDCGTLVMIDGARDPEDVLRQILDKLV